MRARQVSALVTVRRAGEDVRVLVVADAPAGATRLDQLESVVSATGPAHEVLRRSIASATALRLLGTTLARDHEDSHIPQHALDVDQRLVEARAELQLFGEALQAWGRSDLAEIVRRELLAGLGGVVTGDQPLDDLDCFAGWCEVRGDEAAGLRVAAPVIGAAGGPR